MYINITLLHKQYIAAAAAATKLNFYDGDGIDYIYSVKFSSSELMMTMHSEYLEMRVTSERHQESYIVYLHYTVYIRR